ncbi:MAG: GSCFA domain-containing protein [Spirochaetales bacterium]|nr:GSCFA domain-containing protein [Spirochaetales bacterium]
MISLSSDNPSDFYRSKITAVKVRPPEWKLRGGGLFFMGSCFADNLYEKWREARLKARISPFGNIYNPVSLASAAALLEKDGGIVGSDCFKQGEDYYHFMFHSQKCGRKSADFATQLNAEIEVSRNFIRKAEAVVLTLGTAYAYRLLSTGDVVNNCHRRPSGDFERYLLSLPEASGALRETVDSLLRINSKLKIVLTLSPVRHLRDDAAENSLSKAVLRCAIDEALRACPGSVWYFPSYEIVLDELRDYRWYSGDLCHPSDEAVSYIISRFIEATYDDEFKAFLAEWLPILRDLNHRPFSPDSNEHRKFIERVREKEGLIRKRYPDVIG